MNQSQMGAFHPSTQQGQQHGMQAPYHAIPVDMGSGLGLGMLGMPMGLSYAPGTDPGTYGTPSGYHHDMRGVPSGVGQSGMGTNGGMGRGMGMAEEPVPASDQGEFARAIAYVNKIKTRFAGEPETYKTFLELLQRHHAEGNKDGKGEVSLP
jgi:hypothetical protein